MPEGDSVWKAACTLRAQLVRRMMRHALAFRDSMTGEHYARETWWCRRCQPGPFPSLVERPRRPGLRRGVNEESFGSRTRRLRGGTGLARG
ncbi:MAG: hypothetical protein M3486_09520 [Actinomycetota bacterium]|nr:hypothetical protein [Actinomycetota bacterium]